MSSFIHWLISSPGGLAARVGAGIAIFICLAIADLRRNGSCATRWREYSLLLVAVALAILYGALNDQITSRISWEYFYYGKDLEHVLGGVVPPDPRRLHWEAAKIGAMATWSAGLIFGVALLIANNPWKDLPRLKNRQLVCKIGLIFSVTIAMGILFGFLGYRGYLNRLSPDFIEMARADIFRPKRFICTWGAHLGDYLGGVVGTVLACMSVVRQREKLRSRLATRKFPEAS